MTAGWSELVRGGNAGRSAVVGFGMIIHAVNTFVVVTILPSVVRDIGGLRFFAWNTTLYVVASLFGGAFCARLLARLGARATYRLALGVFAAGCLLCAMAPTMPVLLAGRFCQGLGAGTLSALSFTLVRVLFAERLWPRALAVISAAWGVATLLGPTLGGVFAQYTGWRAAFWTLLAMAPCLLLLVERALPRDMAPVAAPRTPLALLNLGVLVASVLAVSAASMSDRALVNGVGLACACGGVALFARLESRAVRVLPRGACNPATPLGAAYASMALLLIGTTCEIFVPYFLQTLHAMTPLHAGYLSALMSGGWTAGSLIASGVAASGRRIILIVGPLVLAVGLAGLDALMPLPDGSGLGLPLIGGCLVAIGLGVGTCWPHVGSRVFSTAADGEKALAASSITVVVMVTNAFGSALGGMVTNLAGLTDPGGAEGASLAASWLFGTLLIAPALAVVAIRKLYVAPEPLCV